MEALLDETVSTEDLEKVEKEYCTQLKENNVTPKAQFDYAYCLVKSKYNTDIEDGIKLLEDLYKKNVNGRRDYLYYLIIGNARLKRYVISLQHVRSFLEIEPANQQVLSLQEIIKKRMKKEGFIGIAVAGGLILAAGAVAAGVGGVVAALSRRNK